MAFFVPIFLFVPFVACFLWAFMTVRADRRRSLMIVAVTAVLGIAWTLAGIFGGAYLLDGYRTEQLETIADALLSLGRQKDTDAIVLEAEAMLADLESGKFDSFNVSARLAGRLSERVGSNAP